MAAPVDVTVRQYCTVSDVMSRIDTRDLPTFSIEAVIRAATARIEGYCDRVFTRVPETENEYVTQEFLGNGMTILMVDDLLELNQILIEGELQDLDNIRRMPFGKTPTTWLEWVSGGVWTKGNEIAIEAIWGFSMTVPWDIWDACVGLCVRAIERAKTAYQDASAIPDMGQLVYAKAMPVDIKQTLDRYRRLAI